MRSIQVDLSLTTNSTAGLGREKRRMRRLLKSCLVLATVVASSCSGSAAGQDVEERLQKVTASVIPAAGEGANIVISDLRSSPARREWRATLNGKTYACDADEQLNLPECRPVGP